MSRIFILFCSCCLFSKIATAQQGGAKVITTDITNFWNAYDKISTTKDTTLQYQYLTSCLLTRAPQASGH